MYNMYKYYVIYTCRCACFGVADITIMKQKVHCTHTHTHARIVNPKGQGFDTKTTAPGSL